MQPLVAQHWVVIQDDLGEVCEGVSGTEYRSADVTVSLDCKTHATQLTRILSLAHSTASEEAMCRTAASAKV